MNIEHPSMGLEIVSGREKKDVFLEKLKGLVGEIAGQINAQAEKESGVKGLLNPDGTISMQGFAAENGGIYTQAEVDEDLKYVKNDELSNSSAFRFPKDSPERQARVKEWQESRGKAKSNQVEMAVMVLLHKMPKDEFLVVRSAKRDDYAGGVDMLIVNKNTGAVICAIDDVHKEGEDDRGKAKKIKDNAENGGTTVRYGLVSRKGKLERVKLKDLPVFYLGLTSEQFNELLAAMGSDVNSIVSAKEIEIFSQFVADLESQKNSLARLMLDPKTNIRSNLNQSGKSIKKINQIAQAAQKPRPEQMLVAA
jgi:hypothetical protein